MKKKDFTQNEMCNVSTLPAKLNDYVISLGLSKCLFLPSWHNSFAAIFAPLTNWIIFGVERRILSLMHSSKL